MSDDLLFQEVDEEVRRERLQKLWQRFGTYFVAACFGVIATVAGFKGWQYWQRTQAEEAGRAYLDVITLIEQDKRDQAQSSLDHLIATGSGGVKQLARLQKAGLLVEAGKTQEAQAAYDNLAQDSSADPALRSLARIRSAYLMVDNADYETLATYLQGLDAADNPWRNSVREILALAAYRGADYLQADRLLNMIIADPAAPAGTRQRALIFREVVKPKLGTGASAS